MKNIFKKIYLTLFCLFPFVTTACYKMNSRIYDESHYTCFLGEKVVDIYGNYIIINNVSYLLAYGPCSHLVPERLWHVSLLGFLFISFFLNHLK